MKFPTTKVSFCMSKKFEMKWLSHPYPVASKVSCSMNKKFETYYVVAESPLSYASVASTKKIQNATVGV
jgi:hypothetical protein